MAILPVLALLCQVSLAEASDPKTVKFVQSFVDTPVSELPENRINDFMAVDPATLPPKLRKKWEARKLELYTLKRIVQVKRAPFRMPENNCQPDDNAKSNDAKVLLAAGYEEISDEEEHFIEKKTECTERDLLCEFTLQITVEKDKKGRTTGRRLFLHPNDPITVFLAEYHSNGGAGGNTNFFGSMKPKCAH